MINTQQKQLFRFFTATVRSEYRLLAFALALMLVYSLVALAQPWPIKILADMAFGREQKDSAESILQYFSFDPAPFTMVLIAGVLSLIVAILYNLTDAVLNWVWTLLGQRLTRRLSTDLLQRLLHLPLTDLRKYSVGDLLSRISTDTWAISKLINSGLITPVTAILSLLVMLIIAFQLSPELTFYAFMTAPLMATATVFFSPKIKRQNRQKREAHGRFTSFVQQTLSSMPLVHAFNAGERNAKRFAELADEAASLNERALILNRSSALVTGLISVTGAAFIVYVGGRKALAGEISVGTFLLFLHYVRSAQGALESLLRLYGTFQPLIVGLERVLELVEIPNPDLSGKRHKLELHHAPAISFENVSFSYLQGQPVLNRINLEIKPGESVAFVGASGAGKSTLLNFIVRLYEPSNGRVLIDGVDIQSLDRRSLREAVAYMFQESFLLSRTVRDNISYGNPDAELSSVVNAARQARADEFITALPLAYETVLAERGSSLSGGERQRLAAARACLRNSRIILMDEPTSACDAVTEAELVETLRTLARTHTIVIVAHRLSTIRWVDRIFVLEAGTVLETGSHDELMMARGKYFHLQKAQSRTSELEAAA